jgi:hypothetical protein
MRSTNSTRVMDSVSWWFHANTDPRSPYRASHNRQESTTNISHFYCLMNFISTTMNVFTRLTPFSNMLYLLCETIGSSEFRKLCAIVCFVGLLSCVLYEAYQAGCWVVRFCCRRLRVNGCDWRITGFKGMTGQWPEWQFVSNDLRWNGRVRQYT